MTIPEISKDLLIRIVKLVAADRWWLLGPIIRSGKKGRDIVYLNEVLEGACIYSLCGDPADISVGGRHRHFFEKCLYAENPTARYYEALRLVSHEIDINKAIQLLHCNVPRHGDATFAAGILSICAGNALLGGKYLKMFHDQHFSLNSDDGRDTGEELIQVIARFYPGRKNTFGKSFSYPDYEGIKVPNCAMNCNLTYGRYLCNDCYLYWCAKYVCGML